MTHLRDMSQIKNKTTQRFPEIRDMVQLLKKHNVDVTSDHDKKIDLLVELENCKTDLEEIATRALGPTKEKILPLQAEESNNVKTKVREFKIKVLEYREDFQRNLPFNTSDTSEEKINQAYVKISEFFQKTQDMQRESD